MGKTSYNSSKHAAVTTLTGLVFTGQKTESLMAARQNNSFKPLQFIQVQMMN